MKVNPKIDIVFKKLFGVEENKDLLISFINATVSQEDQVAGIELLNPYNPPNFKNDRLSILDIKAQSFTGKRFNIEIQVSDEGDYDKRALYYWAKLYTEQLQQGNDYSELNKAIGIHILNFTSIPDTAKYHNVFHITEKETGLHYYQDLELHTIELKKFAHSQQKLPELIQKIHTSLDQWVLFLSRNELLHPDRLPGELQHTQIQKALQVLEVMNLNPQEREEYEGRLKWIRAEASALKKAAGEAQQLGFQQGKNLGLQEGKQLGLQEGKQLGLQEGKNLGLQEGKQLGLQEGIQSIALRMFQQGRSIQEISECTGLSMEHLQQLKPTHFN